MVGKHKFFRLLLLLMLPFAFISCIKESEIIQTPERELRIWLHRVNTIEKAVFFRDLYNGYELDVHFDAPSGNFYVKHDPNEPSNLTLEDWLSGFTRPDLMEYWLDFKNLDTGNSVASFHKLESIRSRFQLNRTIVIESSIPSSLSPYNNGHYLTSYYIPTFNPLNITSEEELEYKEMISYYIDNNSITTISGYTFQLGFMQKWFPQINKLVWYLDSTDPVKKDSVIKIVKEDQTVDILLVSEDFKGEGVAAK